MKRLYNPSNVVIRGFVYEKTRIDLFPKETSELLPDKIAKEAKKTFGFLDVRPDPKDIKPKETFGFTHVDQFKQSEEEKTRQEEAEKKETPLDGMAGLGQASLEKLRQAQIYTREKFFETIKHDPKFMQKLLGNLVFVKFRDVDPRKIVKS